jgi:hypothetical protein
VVVSPSEIDVEIPQNNPVVLRQGLKTIARIIQTLANNVLFGRDAQMSILNPFLQTKIMDVFKFLSELSVRVELCSLLYGSLIAMSRGTTHRQMTRRRIPTNGRVSLTMTQTPLFCTVSSLNMPTRLGRSSLVS